MQNEFQLTLFTAMSQFVSDCNLESEDIMKFLEESIEEISTELLHGGSSLKRENILLSHEIVLKIEARFQHDKAMQEWVSTLY
jgi:hypothetical protein